MSSVSQLSPLAPHLLALLRVFARSGRIYQAWEADACGGYYPAQRRIGLAHPRGCPLDGSRDAVGVGDVNGEEAGPRGAAQLRDELGAGVLVQVEDGDVSAVLGELEGRRTTEARRSRVGDVSLCRSTRVGRRCERERVCVCVRE